MTQTNDGGPASEMTVRQVYAGWALVGIIVKSPLTDTHPGGNEAGTLKLEEIQDLAEAAVAGAFDYADLMLAHEQEQAND